MSEAQDVPYKESKLYRIRHSAAHVMAEAVLEHFPEAKLAIGPPIEDGFYYDFDLGTDENSKPRTFAPEDLEAIEATMKKLLKKNVSERLGSGPEDANPIKAHGFFRHMSWNDVLAKRLEPPFKPTLVRYDFSESMHYDLVPDTCSKMRWT